MSALVAESDVEGKIDLTETYTVLDKKETMTDPYIFPTASVIGHSHFPAVVQQCARFIVDTTKVSTYMIPGTWIQTLHDVDLATLAAMADNVGDEEEFEEVSMANMVYISLATMLLQAEGLDNDTVSVQNAVNQLVAFIAVESIFRKGFIDAPEYDQMSFAVDDPLNLNLTGDGE